MLEEIKELVGELNSEEGAEALGNFINSGVDVITKLTDLVAKHPDFDKMADNIASMSKRVFDSFVRKGFTDEQALRLTAAAVGRK